MNSWKLNGIAGHLTRRAIIKGLNIPLKDLYKTLKSINNYGIIETKEGKKYEIILKEICDESVIKPSIGSKPENLYYEMDREIKITDRQIAHLREEISRVQRQIKMIKEGKTHSGDKSRMDIAVDCCKEIDRVLCEL